MALPLTRICRAIIQTTRRSTQLSSLYCTQSSEDRKKQFDKSLLEILVCPLCKEPLRYDEQKNELISDKIGVAYPIVNGIPNLVPQDARVLKESTGS
ncbi:hypothetical protein ACF0H5_005697 [Mactra antiquata]